MIGQLPFEVMLAHNYLDSKRKPIQDPVGWYMSEKFDGERAIWDGKNLCSRNNNVIAIPLWFRAYLEDVGHRLDGELFLGYGTFHQTGIFRADKPNMDMWERVTYKVFDIPDSSLGIPLSKRLDILKHSVDRLTLVREREPYHRSNIEVVEQTVVRSRAHLDEFYKSIIDSGGEGIVLANPYGLYENTRSKSLLKYKPVYDSEAVIVGYKEGNGKFAGLLGSFTVQPLSAEGKLETRRQFGLSGMTMEIRRNYKKTHPIGTIITYAYRTLTSTGVPLHPSYKGKCGFRNLERLRAERGLIVTAPPVSMKHVIHQIKDQILGLIPDQISEESKDLRPVIMVSVRVEF